MSFACPGQLSFRPILSIYTYRTRRLRGALRLWDGCTRTIPHVAIVKTVSVLLIEVSNSSSRNQKDMYGDTLPRNYSFADPRTGIDANTSYIRLQGPVGCEAHVV